MEVFDREKVRTKGTYSKWGNGKQSLKSKTEGKRKERRLFVLECAAKSLSFQPVRVYVSHPGFLSGVCGGLAPVSPLEQSGTGRPAGWLAAQERKRPLSNSRWRTACAYTAETHRPAHRQTRSHAIQRAN